MDLVSFEMFTNAIGPRQQVNHIRLCFQSEQPLAFLTRDFAAFDYALSELRDSLLIASVKRFRTHG
jgi:hypothetical protein